MPPRERPAKSTRPAPRWSRRSTSEVPRASIEQGPSGTLAPPCPGCSTLSTRNQLVNTPIWASQTALVVPRLPTSTRRGASSGPDKSNVTTRSPSCSSAIPVLFCRKSLTKEQKEAYRGPTRLTAGRAKDTLRSQQKPDEGPLETTRRAKTTRPAMEPRPGEGAKNDKAFNGAAMELTEGEEGQAVGN